MNDKEKFTQLNNISKDDLKSLQMCAQTYYDSDSDLNSEDYLAWEHTDNDEEITLNQSRKYK